MEVVFLSGVWKLGICCVAVWRLGVQELGRELMRLMLGARGLGLGVCFVLFCFVLWLSGLSLPYFTLIN